MHGQKKVNVIESDSFSNIVGENNHRIHPDDLPEIEKDAFLFDNALSADKIIITQETNVLKRILKYPFLVNHLHDIQYIVLPKDETGMNELLAYLQANCEPSKAEYFVFR